jgi:hypothetical protein
MCENLPPASAELLNGGVLRAAALLWSQQPPYCGGIRTHDPLHVAPAARDTASAVGASQSLYLV